MSKGSKGAQQGGTTTTTQAPYQPYLPYIGTGMGQAANLLQSGGQQYYPGQQVADFNPVQQGAFNGTLKMDKNLMQGSGNPYENAMFQQAAGGVGSALQGQFAGSGRDIAGSMPMAQQQENQLATDFYGQNYQNDIQNALMASQQRLGIGNQIQGQAQNNINANMNAWNFNQNRPYNALQQYMSTIGGAMPGTGSTQQPYFTNPTANGLGSLLAAQQLYQGYNNKGSQSPTGGGSSYLGNPNAP